MIFILQDNQLTNLSLDNINYSNAKTILKFTYHLSIVSIPLEINAKTGLVLVIIEGVKKLEYLILNQDLNKVSRSSSNPLKIVKKSINIPNDFLCTSFNSSISL